MKLHRQALLSGLECVKPAIASKELIEELCCVWFDGKYIMAYNDGLGMQIPFQCDLKGGIRGHLLLRLLTHSRAKEIEVELVEDELAEMKAGRTRVRLTLLPGERHPWHFPKLDAKASFEAPTGLLGALSSVQLSIGTGTTKPEQLGTTIIVDGNYLFLYTTDSNSLSEAIVKVPKGWPEKVGRVIWPTSFVNQILKLKQVPELWVTKNYVVAHDDGLMIYAQTVDCPKPFDFSRITNENTLNESILIPKKLRLALERASALLNGQPNERLEVSAKDDILTLSAKTPRGDLFDKIKLGSNITEKEGFTEPDLLKRALPQCKRMGMADKSIVLEGDDFRYYLSTT